MIDFSAVKAIRIPEGSVEKVRGADGNVLWAKAEDVTKVTVCLTETAELSYQRVMVNGLTLTQSGQSVSVPVGTVIQIYGYTGVFEDGVLVGVIDIPGGYINYTADHDVGIHWHPEGQVTIVPL